MNEIFCTRRFLNLFKLFIVESTTLTIPLIVVLFILNTHVYLGSIENYHGILDSQIDNSIKFGFLLMISSVLNGYKSINTMLPVSRFERLMAIWVNSYILMPLIFILLTYLAISLQGVINPTSGNGQAVVESIATIFNGGDGMESAKFSIFDNITIYTPTYIVYIASVVIAICSIIFSLVLYIGYLAMPIAVMTYLMGFKYLDYYHNYECFHELGEYKFTVLTLATISITAIFSYIAYRLMAKIEQ